MMITLQRRYVTHDNNFAKEHLFGAPTEGKGVVLVGLLLVVVGSNCVHPQHHLVSLVILWNRGC